MGNKKFFERSAIGVTLLLAAILRLHGLGAQSFWRDESGTRFLITSPDLHLFELTAPGENIPPPYFFIIRAWAAVFGASDASLRMPSALSGIAAVLMIYFFARRLTRNSSKQFLVGLFAALTLAMSRFHIAYSQEARPYSLAVLLGIISCYAFAVLLTSRRQWPQWLYVLSTAAMFWTHPCTLPLFAAQGVFIGLCLCSRTLQPSGIPLRRWLTLFGAIVLTLSPWIAMADFFAGGGQRWMPRPVVRDIAADYLGNPIAWGMFFMLMTFSLVYAWRQKDAAPILGWLIAIPPIAVPVLMSQGYHSYFVSRYGIVALIGLSLCVCYGAAHFGRIGGSVAMMALCVVLAPPLIADFQTGTNSQVKADLRGCARQIEQMAAPDDAVWCPWDWMQLPLIDYLSDSRLKMLDSLPPKGSPDAARIRRVWLVLERRTDSPAHEQAMLIRVIGSAPYKMTASWLHRGVTLYELELNAVQTPLTARRILPFTMKAPAAWPR